MQDWQHPEDGPRLQATLVALADDAQGPLLALDTSGEVASLALVSPTTSSCPPALRVLELQLAARALPSEAVMAGLVDLLHRANAQPTQLRGIVVGLGPGSFTGLRVGLATAKGLGYGADVPVYGASSLAMLAAACAPGNVAVLRDARRDHVYAGGYHVDEAGKVMAFFADARVPVAGVQAQLEAALPAFSRPALRYVGEPSALAQCTRLPAALALPPPRAALLLLQAAADMRAGRAADLAALAPAYLQDFVPTSPKRT